MKALPETGLTSPALLRLLSVACASGNAVAEVSTGWSEIDRVVMLRRPVSESFLDPFKADAALRFYTEPLSPHWPGDRGFVDEATREALSFPLKGAR
jgi:hypothetical protein